MSARCECGAGSWIENRTLHIQPHSMDCAALRAMVERERQGWCPHCSTKLVSEHSGEVVYCPRGCMRKESGEAALRVFDAIGSGWIRDSLDSEVVE